jgi:origin recognition complex subunit 4
VGPRGAGKTLAAERAVALVAARYNPDPRDPVVGCVRLAGWAHAEERTAFREVARQLCE